MLIALKKRQVSNKIRSNEKMKLLQCISRRKYTF